MQAEPGKGDRRCVLARNQGSRGPSEARLAHNQGPRKTHAGVRQFPTQVERVRACAKQGAHSEAGGPDKGTASLEGVLILGGENARALLLANGTGGRHCQRFPSNCRDTAALQAKEERRSLAQTTTRP